MSKKHETSKASGDYIIKAASDPAYIKAQDQPSQIKRIEDPEEFADAFPDQAESVTAAAEPASLRGPVPDYYTVSYLKQPAEGSPWDDHVEKFPTHEEADARAAALQSSGQRSIRVFGRFWGW